MSEQEEKVLKLCRYWYQTASDISRQTLWYEIGVMLENENAAQQPLALDVGDAGHFLHISDPLYKRWLELHDKSQRK